MFQRLFAGSGLSLDRLRALVEVGASGSIVRAAGDDPTRQSQYSRQIKELEDFFEAGLVERHGKGIRLTARGKELARISRFFLMGLSNFQRGCKAQGQVYRIGASPTFLTAFAVPLLADPKRTQRGVRFVLEPAGEPDIERRLHDLTLDFAVVRRSTLSRPLQVQDLGAWNVRLWVPRSVCRVPLQALAALAARSLPLAWAGGEMDLSEVPGLDEHEPTLTCGTFLEAAAALNEGALAAFLPDFLPPPGNASRFMRLEIPAPGAPVFHWYLAWNPRLVRLNPHLPRKRDTLVEQFRLALAKAGQARARVSKL